MLRRRRGGIGDRLFFVEGDLSALVPEPHAALVGGDGPQPGAEFLRLGQAFQLQVGGDQRLLRRVLGRVEILDIAQAQPEDGVAVTVDQDRVGAVVPFQTRLYQLGVVHGNSFFRAHSPYKCLRPEKITQRRKITEDQRLRPVPMGTKPPKCSITDWT